MIIQPIQTHSHRKYDNGKGGYLRFNDDDEMGYERMRVIMHHDDNERE